MPELKTAAPPATARRLAVFLDGTTDKSEGDTNVWRARSLCADEDPKGVKQLTFYAPGVGTQLGEIARGEIFGYGIDDQVVSAYQWLVQNYEEKDAVFIFGFSRGAFAARSLSGLISRCGLIQPGSPLAIKQLYERYKKGNAVLSIHELLEMQRDRTNYSLEERWMVKDCRPIPITFTGVWDTVGSVARSNNLSLLTGGDHSFLDTNLRQSETFVYHAMAVDENRIDFDVTLLTWYRRNDLPPPYNPPRLLSDCEQRWFAGAHGDVGGGTFNDALAQLPLKWLLSKASLHGLTFRKNIDIDSEAETGAIEDSFSNFLGGAYKVYSFGARHWRAIGQDPIPATSTTIHTINETIDRSVFARYQRDLSYRPANLEEWAERRGIKLLEVQSSVKAEDGSPLPD